MHYVGYPKYINSGVCARIEPMAGVIDAWPALATAPWPMEKGDLTVANSILHSTHAEFLHDQRAYKWEQAGEPMGAFQQSTILEGARLLLHAELLRINTAPGRVGFPPDVTLEVARNLILQMDLIRWYGAQHYGRAFMHENPASTRGPCATFFGRIHEVLFQWTVVRAYWERGVPEFARPPLPGFAPVHAIIDDDEAIVVDAQMVRTRWRVGACNPAILPGTWSVSECTDILTTCARTMDHLAQYILHDDTRAWTRFMQVLELRIATLALFDGDQLSHDAAEWCEWRQDATEGAHVACTPLDGWLRHTGTLLSYIHHQWSVAILLNRHTLRLRPAMRIAMRMEDMCKRIHLWVVRSSTPALIGTENDVWQMLQNTLCTLSTRQYEHVLCLWPRGGDASISMGVGHTAQGGDASDSDSDDDGHIHVGLAEKWENKRMMIPNVWLADDWKTALKTLLPRDGGEYVYVSNTNRAALRKMEYWLDAGDAQPEYKHAAMSVLMDTIFARSREVTTMWSTQYCTFPAMCDSTTIIAHITGMAQNARILCGGGGGVSARNDGIHCARIIMTHGGGNIGVLCGLPVIHALSAPGLDSIEVCAEKAMQFTQSRTIRESAVFVRCGTDFAMAIGLWALILMTYRELGWALDPMDTGAEAIVRRDVCSYLA